jgi:chromate reductase, NAD(P)H dehydrogenase (quinone)
MKILGISGSNRKGSFNTALLEEARRMLPEGNILEIFDVSSFPLFSQNNERNPPEIVREFKQNIKAADAILIASPEHNYTITAMLKNAIEWGNRPGEDNSWDNKPAAIISASTGVRGGVRSQLHLRQIMVDLNMYPINDPELLLGRAREAFDSDLRLRDEATKQLLRKVLGNLVLWAAKINN